MKSDHAYRQFKPNCRTAELPIFLDRLFYKPALIPRIDSFFLGMLNIKLLKYFKFAAPQVRPPRLRLNWVNINAMCYFCLFVFFPELAVFFFFSFHFYAVGKECLCYVLRQCYFALCLSKAPDM